MPRLLLMFGISLALATAARAAEVKFVRVWPGWYDADSFRWISEYFTGQEDTGGKIIRRTQPGERQGYYFVVRVKNAGASCVGAKFVLQIVTPKAPDPLAYSFTADVPPGSNLFNLGLTGADWPGAKVRPVAWRLDLVAADGRILASQQSFLWAMPQGAR